MTAPTTQRQPGSCKSTPPKASKYVHVQLVLAAHAALNRRYSLRHRAFIDVGTRKGTYAPEDDAGIEYRCLAESGDGFSGRVTVSRDYEPGLFYPATVFVRGLDDEGKPLSHNDLLRFVRAARLGSEATMRPLWLPQGYDQDQNPGWQAALKFYPIERAPYWGTAGESLERLMQTRFPRAEAFLHGTSLELGGEGLLGEES